MTLSDLSQSFAGDARMPEHEKLHAFVGRGDDERETVPFNASSVIKYRNLFSRSRADCNIMCRFTDTSDLYLCTLGVYEPNNGYIGRRGLMHLARSICSLFAAWSDQSLFFYYYIVISSRENARNREKRFPAMDDEVH